MNALKKTYVLKLYVAGNTPNSVRALKMLKNLPPNKLSSEIKPLLNNSDVQRIIGLYLNMSD